MNYLVLEARDVETGSTLIQRVEDTDMGRLSLVDLTIELSRNHWDIEFLVEEERRAEAACP